MWDCIAGGLDHRITVPFAMPTKSLYKKPNGIAMRPVFIAVNLAETPQTK